MKFEEVLPALREGKKIRKASWWEGHYCRLASDRIVDQGGRSLVFGKDDLFDLDWEIVKEKKKVKLRDLTEEQFSRWLNANCEKLSENCCSDCPFNIVDCISLNDTCWLKHKDLFSYKFLDQEIEVEE